MIGNYNLNTRDKSLINAATLLLRKVATARITKPGQLLTVTKLLHVLSKLPAVPDNGFVSVMVCSPSQDFGEISTSRWWEVVVEAPQLRISSGGSFYRPISGGDSFTSMSWSAMPEHAGEFYDHRESLRIVPGLRSFPEEIAAIDLRARGYTLEIYDDDNDRLEEDERPDDDK